MSSSSWRHSAGHFVPTNTHVLQTDTLPAATTLLTTLTTHWGSPDMSAQSSVPARFDGQDKDLLDAEASIDPLVNNAPPTPSGMDIN